MSARSTMTMRASFDRDTVAGEADAPVYQPYLGGIPCRLWSQAGREVYDPTHVVVVEDLRMIVPKDTALVVTDRVNGVFDRLGNPIEPSVDAGGRPLGILSILARPDHLELLLEYRTS